jgi:bifunctional non-homologous end joining protein LigD
MTLKTAPLIGAGSRLVSVLNDCQPALMLSEHLEGDGPTIFEHACRLGLEGIVSKRKDSRYQSGRSTAWLKIKNADYQRRKQ